MYQLKKQGLIDHITLSFDLREEYGNTSYVKFGGFDRIAMANKTIDEFKLFKTRDTSDWYLPVNGFETTNGNPFNYPGIISFELDPSVPFIYVPARKLTYVNMIQPFELDLAIPGLQATNLNSDLFYWKQSCSSIA